MPPSFEMIDRTVEAVVFDWEGTAAADRRGSAAQLRRRVLALTAAGVDMAVVSGTDVEDIDRQLRARPAGPGRLWFCVNRGSELYEVSPAGPQVLYRRVASVAEDAGLNATAGRVIDVLRKRGLATRVVAWQRNHRKIEPLSEQDWADPNEVVRIATDSANAAGLSDARITGAARHVEIGLTDKSDSIRELLALLARRGVGPGLVLIVGSEFGPIDSLPGS